MTNEDTARYIHHGRVELLPFLWTDIQKFAIKMAHKYLPRDGSNTVTMDDFISAAYIALTEAVKGYSEEKGAFTTWYAFFLKSAYAELRGWRRRRPDPLDVARSLDAPLTDDSETTLTDVLSDPTDAFEAAETAIANNQAYTVVMRHMKKLEPIQREAIMTTYYNGETLQAAGEQLGLSRERIRQLREKGLRKLRGYREIRKLGEEIYADEHTNFYLHIGVQAFQSGTGSAVENVIERRERLLQPV